MLTLTFLFSTSQMKVLNLWAVEHYAFQRLRKVNLNLCPSSSMPQAFIFMWDQPHRSPHGTTLPYSDKAEGRATEKY